MSTRPTCGRRHPALGPGADRPGLAQHVPRQRRERRSGGRRPARPRRALRAPGLARGRRAGSSKPVGHALLMTSLCTGCVVAARSSWCLGCAILELRASAWAGCDSRILWTSRIFFRLRWDICLRLAIFDGAFLFADVRSWLWKACIGRSFLASLEGSCRPSPLSLMPASLMGGPTLHVSMQ